MRTIIKKVFNYLVWKINSLSKPKGGKYNNSNKKILVVGNGKSAKNFNYLGFKSKGYDICCVNMFFKDTNLFFLIKPSFYCIVDPAFFLDSFLEESDGIEFVALLNKIDWDFHIITISAKHAKKVIEKCNNPFVHVDIINDRCYPERPSKKTLKRYSKNIATCGYQNVIVAAIYYFIVSHTKQIVLTGVENDWHRELEVLSNNEVIRRDTHFYGEQILNLTRNGEINKGELYKYFLYYSSTLKQYSILSLFAEYNNVKILNSCMNSFIDAFEKKESNSIINH